MYVNVIYVLESYGISSKSEKLSADHFIIFPTAARPNRHIFIFALLLPCRQKGAAVPPLYTTASTKSLSPTGTSLTPISFFLLKL